MHRPLLLLNLILAAVLAVLWSVETWFSGRKRDERARASTFHLLAEPDSPAVANVARVELQAGSGQRFIYERRSDGWRIPQYHDAYALGQNLESMLAALLERRGTVVGRVPQDARHFGLTADESLKLDLHDASGALLLHAEVGMAAPGPNAPESFAVIAGRDRILHLHSNPRSFAESKADESPPLLDTRVIQPALSRSLPVRVVIDGLEPGAVREILRREVADPERQRRPRPEWHGLTDGAPEKHLNDTVAFKYVGFVRDLTFDELLGDIGGHEDAFTAPALTVTLHYEDDSADALILGESAQDGQRFLHNSTTGQVFLISAEKAARLRPDSAALLEPPKQAPPPGS